MSEGPKSVAQPCDLCRDVVEHPHVPHVKRRCQQCGREMCIVEPGEHGKGINVRAGDQFVIPAGWIKLSMDPLATSVIFSRAGLDMMAATFFLEELHKKGQNYEATAAEVERQMDHIVKLGAYPTVGQARPEDLAATMFEALGIDPETEIRDKLNKPMPISRGKTIREVLG